MNAAKTSIQLIRNNSPVSVFRKPVVLIPVSGLKLATSGLIILLPELKLRISVLITLPPGLKLMTSVLIIPLT